MKKIFLLLFICFNLLNANVGKITSFVGDVLVIRDNQEIPVTKGMILELNDTIKTSNNSKALIHMKDETTINVGKKSSLSVKEFVIDEVNPTKSKASFNFGNGLFRTITGKIGKLNPKRFKIKTKTGSIGIRGTIFDVVVTPDLTKVGVIEGGVYYVNEETKNLFDVKVGQKLIYDDEKKEINIIEGPVEEATQLSNEDTAQEEVSTTDEKQEEEKEEASTTEEKEEEQTEQKEEETQTSEKEKEEETSITNEKQEETQEETSSNNENSANSNVEQETQSEANNTPNEESSDNSATSNNEPIDDTIPDDPNVPDEAASSQINAPNSDPIVNDPKLEEEIVNKDPIINISNSNTTRENEVLKISFSTSDPDNDETTIKIKIGSDEHSFTFSDSNSDGTVSTHSDEITMTNGKIKLNKDKNEFTYTPNEDTTGEDTFTIIVTDTRNASTQTEVKVTIENYDPSSQAPSTTSSAITNLDTISELIEGVTKETVGSDNYMQFGFLKSDGVINDVFSTGTLTPSVVIDGYITNKSTARYNGTVAAIITNSDDTKEIVRDGTINLNFDFENESFTGNVKVNDNWNANINGGAIQGNNFNSNNLSSDSTSTIQDITGDVNGNFVGTSAQSTTGKINLNSATSGSVKASFGATKQGDAQ